MALGRQLWRRQIGSLRGCGVRRWRRRGAGGAGYPADGRALGCGVGDRCAHLVADRCSAADDDDLAYPGSEASSTGAGGSEVSDSEASRSRAGKDSVPDSPETDSPGRRLRGRRGFGGRRWGAGGAGYPADGRAPGCGVGDRCVHLVADRCSAADDDDLAYPGSEASSSGGGKLGGLHRCVTKQPGLADRSLWITGESVVVAFPPQATPERFHKRIDDRV